MYSNKVDKNQIKTQTMRAIFVDKLVFRFNLRKLFQLQVYFREYYIMVENSFFHNNTFGG